MKEELDARTLLITVPKRPKRSRRPAHRAGMPSQTGGPYQHSNGPFGGYSNGYEYPNRPRGTGRARRPRGRADHYSAFHNGIQAAYQSGGGTPGYYVPQHGGVVPGFGGAW